MRERGGLTHASRDGGARDEETGGTSGGTRGKTTGGKPDSTGGATGTDGALGGTGGATPDAAVTMPHATREPDVAPPSGWPDPAARWSPTSSPR